MTSLQLGPLMTAVLDVQQRQHDALRYPAIVGYAAAVASVARTRSCDLVWAVDAGAQKLLGAVEMLTCGAIESRSFASVIAGRSILLVGSVAVSEHDLARGVKAARGASAAMVFGCAIDARCECEGLDGFNLLTPVAAAMAQSA